MGITAFTRYVIVIIEVESDTPGLDAVHGPYETYERANEKRELIRASRPDVDPSLIQVEVVTWV